MLRPARLLALLDWSDREASSGRRGLVRPSLPEVGRPDLVSGITTQPSWGKTVTGLPPAGALPLQAAHSVLKVKYIFTPNDIFTVQNQTLLSPVKEDNISL